MSERVKFHFDEQVDLDIAKALRRRGIDVITAQEAKQRQTDDALLLETALNTNRVFVTQDADALRLAARNVQHARIVYAPQNTPIGELLRYYSARRVCQCAVIGIDSRVRLA